MLGSWRNTVVTMLFGACALLACSAVDKEGTGSDQDPSTPDERDDAGVSDRSDAGERDADSDDAGSPGACDGGGSGCTNDPPEPTCGDGLINVPGEQCDDANAISDDGCTAACMRDPDYACPEPGKPCVYGVKCADGKLGGAETCEDGNARSGDGCDEACQLEDGYVCPVLGLACEARACGDGIIAGHEECDFEASVVGCTDCRIDEGADCNRAGCHPTVCGDGKKEHGEPCDDGDHDPATEDQPFDGCYRCKAEPECAAGVCKPVCGDGQRFADEACDDGNVRAGDGCSDTCTIEPGFACSDLESEPPPSLSLPVVLRDFIGKDRSLVTGCDSPITMPGTSKPCFHIDFNRLSESTPAGVVEDALDASGRPVYSCPDPAGGCAMNPGHVPNRDRFTYNGKGAFRAWYDSSSPFVSEVVENLTLARVAASGVYVFDSSPSGGFYPLDGQGWVARGLESATKGCLGDALHNVSFTSETHFWFEYQGGESFEFVGDDDLWVFVNGQLTLDLGGVHGARTARFQLGPVDDDGNGTLEVAVGSARTRNQLRNDWADPSDFSHVELGLSVGGVYEVSMFHAERNECGSNFKVTLKDFNRPRSQCASTCGDGLLASDELCDLGAHNVDPPPYGGCAADCKSRGHFCGDGSADLEDGEDCDDGSNVTLYGTGEGDCAPDCRKPAFCGDGVVQSAFGEACDDGHNDGAYGACAASCVLGPRCGDGKVQGDQGEQCDDGNRDAGDGCNASCRADIIL
jgi:fibro-slime domain-containing protein